MAECSETKVALLKKLAGWFLKVVNWTSEINTRTAGMSDSVDVLQEDVDALKAGVAELLTREGGGVCEDSEAFCNCLTEINAQVPEVPVE